ncbi:hypothetical protein [Ligaoa zhengdingensis]|uniref:hypothetical protein n=1 Tax=Ligaoa zhengdingensis TaxID=2763658 RepID=UPI0031BAC9B0
MQRAAQNHLIYLTKNKKDPGAHRGHKTPPGMRPGAMPRKTLAKAWGAVAEAVKPGANPPGSAWQCAKPRPQQRGTTPPQKAAKAGQDVANHPARLLFEDAKRALHVSYSYSTPNVSPSFVQRRPPA